MNKIHGGNIWQIAKENGLKPEDIIDFSASINPLGLSPKAEAAIKNAVSFLGHYPEPNAEAIRVEFALYHNLPEENILAGNGSTEFIYLQPQIFKPKKTIIVEPAFSEYRNSLNASGCEIEDFVCREEDDFFPDVERLCSAIKKGFDAVYIGNPANPTGVLLSKKDILRIAEECRRNNAVLIIDEAFMDFAEHESVKREAVLFDNLIVLRSMTKFFAMPGLRLGYVIAHENIIKRFGDFMPPWSVNAIAIAAGIESLIDAEHIKKTREWLASEMPLLMQGLRAMPYLKTYPSKVNYLLVKILSPAILAGDIQIQLLKNGLLIRDCGSFTGLDSGFFRVAVKKRSENIFLLDSVHKMFAGIRL